MFTKNETLIKYKEELIELKNIIDIAVIELEKDPKKYYESIKDYLYDTNYNDFLESLSPDFRIKSTTHLCFMGLFEKNRHYNLGY